MHLHCCILYIDPAFTVSITYAFSCKVRFHGGHMVSAPPLYGGFMAEERRFVNEEVVSFRAAVPIDHMHQVPIMLCE